jgi:hypothetical protein
MEEVYALVSTCADTINDKLAEYRANMNPEKLKERKFRLNRREWWSLLNMRLESEFEAIKAFERQLRKMTDSNMFFIMDDSSEVGSDLAVTDSFHVSFSVVPGRFGLAKAEFFRINVRANEEGDDITISMGGRKNYERIDKAKRYELVISKMTEKLLSVMRNYQAHVGAWNLEDKQAA